MSRFLFLQNFGLRVSTLLLSFTLAGQHCELLHWHLWSSWNRFAAHSFQEPLHLQLARHLESLPQNLLFEVEEMFWSACSRQVFLPWTWPGLWWPFNPGRRSCMAAWEVGWEAQWLIRDRPWDRLWQRPLGLRWFHELLGRSLLFGGQHGCHENHHGRLPGWLQQHVQRPNAFGRVCWCLWARGPCVPSSSTAKWQRLVARQLHVWVWDLPNWCCHGCQGLWYVGVQGRPEELLDEMWKWAEVNNLPLCRHPDREWANAGSRQQCPEFLRRAQPVQERGHKRMHTKCDHIFSFRWVSIDVKGEQLADVSASWLFASVAARTWAPSSCKLASEETKPCFASCLSGFRMP